MRLSLPCLRVPIYPAYSILSNTDVRTPDRVQISSITPTSATVQFTLTDPFDVTRPEGFVVMYGLISGQLNSNSSVITATSSSQTYSITLTSLQSGTQYFYRIIATNQFVTRMTDEITFVTNDTSKLIIEHMHTCKVHTCSPDVNMNSARIWSSV